MYDTGIEISIGTALIISGLLNRGLLAGYIMLLGLKLAGCRDNRPSAALSWTLFGAAARLLCWMVK